jgi:hypothetical protein
MAAKVKYRVNLLNAFNEAYADKKPEVKRQLRQYLSDPLTKETIGRKIIDKIIYRTKIKKIDKNNVPFVSYSKSYIQSLPFKIYGKIPSRVNLKLSGEMLASMVTIDSSTFTIQIEMADQYNNDKAHGNINGTYGQKKSTGKRRDFLGLPNDDVVKIVKETINQISKSSIDVLIEGILSEASLPNIALNPAASVPTLTFENLLIDGLEEDGE